MTPCGFSHNTGRSHGSWGRTMWRRAAIKPARLVRILIAGIGLQVLIAGLMLNVPAARAAFDLFGGLVAALQSATGSGTRLVFGYLAGGPAPFETVRPETSF